MNNHNPDYETKVARSKLEYEIELAMIKMRAGESGDNYDKNWDF